MNYPCKCGKVVLSSDAGGKFDDGQEHTSTWCGKLPRPAPDPQVDLQWRLVRLDSAHGGPR